MTDHIYIATFYSHFGAIRFQKALKKAGLTGEMMPVPRDLSSSCGTCVRFEADAFQARDGYHEIEQIVRVGNKGYECIYRAEDS